GGGADCFWKYCV
nr:urotensin IIalpha [Cyprinus carpio]